VVARVEAQSGDKARRSRELLADGSKERSFFYSCMAGDKRSESLSRRAQDVEMPAAARLCPMLARRVSSSMSFCDGLGRIPHKNFGFRGFRVFEFVLRVAVPNSKPRNRNSKQYQPASPPSPGGTCPHVYLSLLRLLAVASLMAARIMS